MPLVGCYDEVWRLAPKQLDGHVLTVRWHALLLKLKLVLCFRSHNNMKHAGDSKYIEVYVYQK